MKPLARYAALNNFVELGHSLGLDPAQLVRDVGLDPASLSLQDRWVPAEAIADLLERSAAASGREDFGLALAHYRRLANLGPLSLVIREEPDVRSALGVLIRHQHMYNEALRTRLSEVGGIATLRITLDVGVSGEFRQSVELAVAVLHQLLQGFISPDWHPVGVTFTHPPPDDARTHNQFFGTVVRFGQDSNGISLYTKDLDTRNVMSDPELRRYTQDFLDDTGGSADPRTEYRVRELIELLLPTGRCSVDQVARSLGVDRRTVHRRLAAEGETFSSVLDSIRVELAKHMVGNRRHALIEIAELLGFSSPGNFSRWFRQRFGQTPTQWRRQYEVEPA
ncbi:AraC family transcriptional regulator [Gordonia sp. SL306]|uniref:AraC family transcriptional regulator n=1 Tax=Gordonia sp. SL306 TaxID=2995145 RepID=UPI0022721896|nr:AraC family transcriptional regulator [Gordonia sp. SL306]WAC57714.1 AraC family transcriptional regulator [Gordonia sp. SL306]